MQCPQNGGDARICPELPLSHVSLSRRPSTSGFPTMSLTRDRRRSEVDPALATGGQDQACQPMAGRVPAASLGKRIEALALTPLLFAVTLGVGWLVWCVLEWRNGRTPSYRLLGLRVVRQSDGRPIRLVRSLARSSICCLLIATDHRGVRRYRHLFCVWGLTAR